MAFTSYSPSASCSLRARPSASVVRETAFAGMVMSTSATSSPVALSVKWKRMPATPAPRTRVKLVLEHKLVAEGFFLIAEEDSLRIGIYSLHNGGIDAIVEGNLLLGEHFGTAFAGNESIVFAFEVGEAVGDFGREASRHVFPGLLEGGGIVGGVDGCGIQHLLAGIEIAIGGGCIEGAPCGFYGGFLQVGRCNLYYVALQGTEGVEGTLHQGEQLDAECFVHGIALLLGRCIFGLVYLQVPVGDPG
jgi:hypothetical protein